MTHEEIIKMADQAEFVSHGQESEEESELFVCVDKDIYKFAKLVAAHEREALCKTMEEQNTWDLHDPASTAIQIIRARGQHT